MYSLYEYVHSSIQESKSFVEQRLLEIKGVISFTFDISRHRCFVRTRNEVNAEVRLDKLTVAASTFPKDLIVWAVVSKIVDHVFHEHMCSSSTQRCS